MMEPGWITAMIAAAVSIATAAFGYLKRMDVYRFRAIEADVTDLRKEKVELLSRIRDLEVLLEGIRKEYRDSQLAWERERTKLNGEIAELRSTVARLEIGKTAAILVSDAHGEIIEANPMAEELTGFSQSELIGEPVRKLIPFRYRATYALAFSEVATGKRPMRLTSLDSFLLTKTGGEVPVSIHLSHWICEEGHPVFGAEIRRRST
jgi:PAS domain S-box-containing protein